MRNKTPHRQRLKYSALFASLISAGVVYTPARAACTNGYTWVGNSVTSNLGVCQAVYFGDTRTQNLFSNDDTGTTITASGDDMYTDQRGPNAGDGASAVATFIAVNSNSLNTAIELQGSQKIVGLATSGTETGISVGGSSAGSTAALLLNGADLQINLLTRAGTGIFISGNGVAPLAGPYSASATLTGGTKVAIDATLLGIYVEKGGAWNGNDPTGSLTIGAAISPNDGIKLVNAGSFVSTSSINVNANHSGISVGNAERFSLDGGDQTRSAVNVLGWSASGTYAYETGIDYSDAGIATGLVKNVTINMLDTGANGFYGNGYGVNMQQGSLALDHVTINSQNIDGAAVTGIGGTLNATALTINAQGKGTAGIQSERHSPNSMSFTLGGATTNTVQTNGDADPSSTAFGNYKYAAGINLLDGTVNVSNTNVITTGTQAYGIYLSQGRLNAHVFAGPGTGVSVQTSGAGADGVVYNPQNANTAGLSVAFDPSTRISTTGENANGFAADGENLNRTTSPFSLSFDSLGLDFASFSLSGAGAAAIDARNGAEVVLGTGNLGAATLSPGAFGAKAEALGKVTFTNTTRTGGAGLWAAQGGTLAFNGTSDASGSTIVLDQGANSQGGGLLDLSGRSSDLKVGLLESNGSGALNGVVNLGSNSLVLDGAGVASPFQGTIQGSGGLTMAGTGTQVLSGAHVFDYTGATRIQSGTLAVQNAAIGKDAAGNWKVFQIGAPGQPGGTLDVSDNGGVFELGGISGAGTVKLGTMGSPVSTLALADAGTSVFSGTIAGDGGVTLQGGTQTFSGSNVFDYTGETQIAGGTLKVGGAGGNHVTSSLFRFTSTGGTLDVSGGGFTLGGIATDDGATNATVALGSPSAPANLTIAGSGNYAYAGTISGTGDIVKSGTGVQTLSGTAAFANTGKTVVQDGVLEIRNISNPAQFNYTVELNGGWLDLSDSSFDPTGATATQWAQLHVTDGANAARGGILAGNDKITLGQNGADQSEAAQIGGDGSNVNQQGVFVVKSGSNTVTLAGDNHYVGYTRIAGGTLKVSQDSNLGETNCSVSTACEREVILDGGNLEIAGDFTSQRQLQLRQDGQVRVDAPGVAATTATLGSVAGEDRTLTKTGAGTLVLTGESFLGHADVQQGALDLGPAVVDATKMAGSNAITQAEGTTVNVASGAISSATDAIVANGTSTVNLSSGTTVTAGVGSALYRVTSGTGTLNATSVELTGLLQAQGAGSQLALHLAGGSVYTGTPSVVNGATASLSTDATSTWNATGDAALTGLDNQGTIVFADAAATGQGVGRAAMKAAQTSVPAYHAITVDGNYTGGGTVKMRTDLSNIATAGNPNTDRLLISGSASGQTTLSVSVSGSGAIVAPASTGQPTSTQGISLVQVGGSANANSFKLAGDYVAVPGSPFQYRLFSYGPSGEGLPDYTQSALPAGQAQQWDYRLEAAYDDPTPTSGRLALVPQGSTYLTAPLALQHYEATIVDKLYRRLGDIRHGVSDPSGAEGEVFARTIDSRSAYHSDLPYQSYGFNFNQTITALQFGGDWLHRSSPDHDMRLGVAFTLGHTSVTPQAAAASASTASIDTYGLALTGTWQRHDGWYVDGVLSVGRYVGTVNSEQRGEVGRISANGYDASVETGRTFGLPYGIEMEPHVQWLAQALRFDSGKDKDDVVDSTSDLFALTGRLGVRFSVAAPGTLSWRPYMRIDLLHTWMNSPKATLSGQSFEIGKPGSAMELGIGATGMLTPALSIYGEFSGRQRLGRGFSDIGATLGVRYSF